MFMKSISHQNSSLMNIYGHVSITIQFRNTFERFVMTKKEELENLVKIWRVQIKDNPPSWVIFEHGTCVIVKEANVDIKTQAKEILKKWGPVVPGTDLGDFSVADIDDEQLWLVTYTHPDIANIVNLTELSDEAGENPIGNTAIIGITGRNKRQEDAKTLNIIYIEDNFTSKE